MQFAQVVAVWFSALCFVVASLWLIRLATDASANEDVSKIEKKLDIIIHAMGIDEEAVQAEMDAQLTERFLTSLREDPPKRKADAILRLRNISGRGLKEAKAFVEELEASGVIDLSSEKQKAT